MPPPGRRAGGGNHGALATTSLGGANRLGRERAGWEDLLADLRAIAEATALRAENLLHGRVDLDDTVRRLQAFEAFETVGADVLYAPGLRTLEEMRTVMSSVGRPVDVVMGFADPSGRRERAAMLGAHRSSTRP